MYAMFDYECINVMVGYFTRARLTCIGIMTCMIMMLHDKPLLKLVYISEVFLPNCLKDIPTYMHEIHPPSHQYIIQKRTDKETLQRHDYGTSSPVVWGRSGANLAQVECPLGSR
jgi:hypothetical protein